MFVVAALLLAALPTLQSQIVREPRTALVAVPTGPAPTGIRTGSTPSSIHIKWNCPAGASGYDVVYVAPNGGQSKLNPSPIPGQCVQDLQAPVRSLPNAPIGTSTVTTYSQGFTHSGLSPGSSHVYVVVALYPNGATGATAPITAQVGLHPVPSSFTAVSSGRSAQLSWAPVPGVTGYQIHRKLVGEAGFQQVATTPATTTAWADPTVLPPGQHGYFVQAASGLPAAAVTVTTPPWPAPANVSAADFGAYVTVHWDLVAGVTGGYLVFRQRQGEAGFSQITPSSVRPLPPPYVTSGLSHQDPNPVFGQRVSYWVKAVDGDQSAVVSTIPGSFRTLQLTGFCGQGTLDFRWGGAGSGAVVKVLRAIAPDGRWFPTTEYPGSGGQFIRITGNPVGVVQYYKLRATWPTGITESVVVPITIPATSKGFEDFPIRSTTPVKDVILEWQCR